MLGQRGCEAQHASSEHIAGTRTTIACVTHHASYEHDGRDKDDLGTMTIQCVAGDVVARGEGQQQHQERGRAHVPERKSIVERREAEYGNTELNCS